MRLPAPLSAAALLALALVVAACGGSGAAPSASPGAPSAPASEAPGGESPTPAPTDDGAAPTPGTALDACEILTPADIEAAVDDAEVEEGELKERPTSLSPGRTECTYQGDWGRLIVELTPEDGANLYDAARGSYADAVDITGVGDGAFNSDGQKRAFVWQGSVAVMFTMFVNGVERYDLAQDLAKAVVEKL